MKKFLIKLTIKLLKWLRDSKKINIDLDSNDKNDLTQWIEWLEGKLK